MIVLNTFEGTPVRIDLFDAELDHVFAMLADAAREDGITFKVDRRIKGKISLKLEEPWNLILLEILAGVNIMTIVSDRLLVVSLPHNPRQEHRG